MSGGGHGVAGLSGRLIKLRLSKGLTEEQLAMLAGCSRITVMRMEYAPPRTGMATIEKLARALGVSPALLAFGDEDE